MEDLGHNTLELTIPSNPKFLGLVRGLIQDLSHQMKFPRGIIKKMALAVDEALTNVIKHAYLGDWTKKITIRLSSYEDRLEILIKDFGRKANPETFKPRRLEDVKPGGLGIFFIQQIMDEVNYDTSPEVGTELRLVKFKKMR